LERRDISFFYTGSVIKSYRYGARCSRKESFTIDSFNRSEALYVLGASEYSDSIIAYQDQRTGL